MVYHSASATFYAPREICGPNGIHHEMIRATPLWWDEYPRCDTVLIKTDTDALGIDAGIDAVTVARVRGFFQIHDHVNHKCGLVEWFVLDAAEPDPVIGMWVVRTEVDADGNQVMDIIPIDSIVRASMLLRSGLLSLL